MAEEKACRRCGFIITNGTVCPICNSKDLTDKWDNYVIILNAEKSEIAASHGISINGRFALNLH